MKQPQPPTMQSLLATIGAKEYTIMQLVEQIQSLEERIAELESAPIKSSAPVVPTKAKG